MGAVDAACRGKTGVMMTFVRESGDEYFCRVESAEISSIANAVRQVPDEFINETADGITDEGVKYLAPLILGEVSPKFDKGIPQYIKL
jgi:6-phosphofructokinase 1